jgi:hypothetical protein
MLEKKELTVYTTPEVEIISLRMEGTCLAGSPGVGENEGTGEHQNEP